MPKITAQGKTIDCAVGANLRQVLLAADVDLYNGQARVINCRGIGSCGTCAVQIEGVADAVSAVNWRDGRRPVPRTIVPVAVCPPTIADGRRPVPWDHRPLRLACQTRVQGDSASPNTMASGAREQNPCGRQQNEGSGFQADHYHGNGQRLIRTGIQL
jgi:ferredoxin